MLKRFKNTLPDRIVTYINEEKVTKISAAAQLADEFVLFFLVRIVVVERQAVEKVYIGESGCLKRQKMFL